MAKVIGELKPKKAPGGDQITPKMLIELPNSAVEYICKLLSEKMEKIHYHYDTKAWKRPHNSVILQTN